MSFVLLSTQGQSVVWFWALGFNNSSELENSSRVPALNREESALVAQAIASAYGEPKANVDKALAITNCRKNELLCSSADSGSDAVEIVSGLFEGAICRPAKALGQALGLTDKASAAPDQPSSDKHKTGMVVGSLIPYVGLVGLTRGASAQIFGECCAPPVYRLVSEQATAGFLLGSLLTPSDVKSGEGLWSTRLSQGGMSAAIFASMTGASAALDRDLPKPDADSQPVSTIARKLSISVLTGALGEVVDSAGKTSFSVPVEESLSTAMSSTAINSITDQANKVLTQMIAQNAHKNTNDQGILR